MHVYEKVRAYIDEKGIKQVTLAQKVNIPMATFNAMMNGKRTMYADDLRAICYALEVSPEMFVEYKAGIGHIEQEGKAGNIYEKA